MREGGLIMKNCVLLVVFLVLVAAVSPVSGGWSTPVPVPEVNTEFTEKAPFLSSDGKTLYFARQNTDTYYESRLFAAARSGTEGPFTQVTQAGNFGPGHVESPWLSPDNLRLYYYRAEIGNDWRVKMSERASVNDPWLPGTDLSDLNDFGDICSFALSADERTVVFALLESPDYWHKDLWMATRPDRYSSFANLTHLAAVSAPGDDMSPNLSPDGLTLYFCSTRNDGAFQIFKSQRPSLSHPFGAAEHLSCFDTPDGNSTDPAFSSDGNTLYFTRRFWGETSDICVSYLPEPTTLLLLALGAAALRRRNSQLMT